MSLPNFDRQFVVKAGASNVLVGVILDHNFGQGLQLVTLPHINEIIQKQYTLLMRVNYLGLFGLGSVAPLLLRPAPTDCKNKLFFFKTAVNSKSTSYKKLEMDICHARV